MTTPHNSPTCVAIATHAASIRRVTTGKSHEGGMSHAGEKKLPVDGYTLRRTLGRTVCNEGMFGPADASRCLNCDACHSAAAAVTGTARKTSAEIARGS